MAKNLYSLMLTDDVIAEIDRLALRENMTRSGLVDRILADYASMMTPEKRIGDICRSLSSLMSASTVLVPVSTQSRSSVSAKSSLEYKYRPTIRYEVQLLREPDTSLGYLSIFFRTTSDSLLNALAGFFRLLKRLEDIYAAPVIGSIRYELCDGKFTRSLSVPRTRDYTSEDIGKAISDYIETVDDMIKGYINGRYGSSELEARYLSYLKNAQTLI